MFAQRSLGTSSDTETGLIFGEGAVGGFGWSERDLKFSGLAAVFEISCLGPGGATIASGSGFLGLIIVFGPKRD